MSAESMLQGALFTALSGDAGVLAAGATVFDVAPQAGDGGAAAPFPYIEIGMIVLSRWDTYAELGFDFVARIHVRSRSAGMKQGKDIQGAIYDRLHRGALTLTGYRLIDLMFDSSTPMRAPDGTFHGVSEFRGLMQKL
jgi:hypothetical protein